ncbi:hypothetical protein C5167_039431 [Papaver somniferum]|uniref:Uncharacterized protein n=1 Tax=Papaver somniferum TaxID=3469 RepID=A0A4Y7ICB3_PAPSO|nr:hypothetical protein C5167_039431 [Papaver somniferum]
MKNTHINKEITGKILLWRENKLFTFYKGKTPPLDGEFFILLMRLVPRVNTLGHGLAAYTKQHKVQTW